MKTKIIATVGPACNSPEMLSRLIDAGVRIFRLNFSHGDAAYFERLIDDLRVLEKKHNIPLTIMQDLSGPKIRIGELAEPINMVIGDTCLLGPKKPDHPLDIPFIPFDKKEILEGLEEGDRLVLADGTLQLTVLERWGDNAFVLEAQNNGVVTSRKGLALPGKSVRLPALTEKDKKDLRDGLRLGVDAVALSYVQTPEDILDAKAIIGEHGRNIPVVAKLERQNAVDRLDDILKVVDIVMVARGDLGIECPLPLLPAMQKRIIHACNQASIPVIVATQMLLSMVNSPSPTRAETTDVANAVLDGADCVMLSEETAMGSFPVETVEFMLRIAGAAEDLMYERRSIEKPASESDVSEFLSYAACLLAEKSSASAIVAHSISGAAGRVLSSRRAYQPVYVLTPHGNTLRHLNFSWGILPRQVSEVIPGHLERAETFIENSPEFKKGESIVITAGQPKPGEKGMGTNLVKIYRK